MVILSSKDRKKNVVLVILIVFAITSVTLLIAYGIKYFSKPEDSETITKPNIQEPLSPLNTPKVPLLSESQVSPEPPKDSPILPGLQALPLLPKDPSEPQIPPVPQLFTEPPKDILIPSEAQTPPELPKDPPILSEPQTSPDPPKIPSVISEPELPPQFPKMPPILLGTQVPQVFLDLEKKIFTERGPLELSEEELQGLELLSSLKDDDPFFKDILSSLKDDYPLHKYTPSSLKNDDPILRSKKRCLTIRKLYKDIKIAIDAYENIKKGDIILKLPTLSPEAINSFWNLTAEGVSCFKFIRYKLQESPTESSANDSQTKMLQILDFRLDDFFESKLYSSQFPNFPSFYKILLRPSFILDDLKELLFTFPIAKKYSKHNPSIGSASRVFEIFLFEKFFAIASFELENNPCDLFNLFKADFNLLLMFTCLSESFSNFGNSSIRDEEFLETLRDALTSDKSTWVFRSYSFLKHLMNSFFLPDLSSEIFNQTSFKNEKTYRALLDLIEKFHSNFSILHIDPEYDLPIFIKYWRFSFAKEPDKSFLLSESETNFDSIKSRFLASQRKQQTDNFYLIPIIYWSLNFRLPQNFNMEFLAFLSDPRDIILIMICSHPILCFKEKDHLVKFMYTEKEWFFHKEFFDIFAYTQYSLYNSIPFELIRKELRKEDLNEWHIWNSHLHRIVERLQKINKIFFPGLLKQATSLHRRQLEVQKIRRSYKRKFETLLGNVDLNAKPVVILKPFFQLLEELKEKNIKEYIDYSNCLELQLPDTYKWLVAIANNLIGLISYPNNSHLKISCDSHLSLTSFEELKILYDSSESSTSKKKGIFDLFENMNRIIEMENTRLAPKDIKIPILKSISEDLDKTTHNRITSYKEGLSNVFSYLECSRFLNFTFDLECSHFSSSKLLEKFGVNKEDFLYFFELYFRKFPQVVHGLQKLLDANPLVVEYGKIEISYFLKFNFWSKKTAFFSMVENLCRTQNFPTMLGYWDSFVLNFKDLLNEQCELAEMHPNLKINVFAGINLSAKVIRNDNDRSVLNTINNLFRFLERLVDLHKPKVQIKEMLEKVLLFPLLFRRTEFKSQRLPVYPFETSKLYEDIYSKLREYFSKYFFSQKPTGFDLALFNVFRNVKKHINEKNLPLDPCQVMIIGREKQAKDLFAFDNCVYTIFKELKYFQNPEQNKSSLEEALDCIQYELKELVKDSQQFQGLVISFNAVYDKNLSEHPNLLPLQMQPCLRQLFLSLDEAYYRGEDLMQIINNFVDTQLKPHIPKD
jgi:hypothetical protein